MAEHVEPADGAAEAAAAVLAGLVRTAVPAVAEWFETALQTAARAAGDDRVLSAYAGAERRLRGGWVRASDDQRRVLAAAEAAGAVDWSVPRMARAALLRAACLERSERQRADLVARLFRTGDNAEREALLGALVLLPEPGLYLETAVDACRTNVVTVFEAIACENRYPHRYFPEASFNQMVLKALFLGVSVQRIAGLVDRVNAELVRMALAYASERRAAGRPVPADIAVITAGGQT